MRYPSLAGMVTAAKAKITRMALHYRFSAQASAFMLNCLEFVLQQKFNNLGQIDTELLRPFRRVLLVDSTSWDVNEKLRGVLPGSGGAASAANCKLQTVYDYKHSELEFLDVTAGTVPDNRYTDHLPGILQKGDLLLMDLGYFKLTTLAGIIEKDAYFLTRFLVRTTPKNPLSKVSIDLAKHLNTLQENEYEMQILMGGNGEHPEFTCRLIALRVSEDIANERRRKLKKAAKKKGRTVSKRHLQMCEWTLLITNIPQDCLSTKMARAFYTVRWQIELLFKQLKSVVRIHQSDTGNEHRLRCELYGKLIIAAIIHRIHAFETHRQWNTKRREVSMDKLYKRIQERALTLFFEFHSSFRQAVAYLKHELKHIMASCLKDRQPSRPTTLEIIEAQCDPMLENRGPTRKKGSA